MAARRVSASTVDWAAFARKIPAAQKASFTALKQKSDGFMRAVNALPAAAPKIDFETYKSKVAVAGMVDDFQKKYEALDIPYPADNVSASVRTNPFLSKYRKVASSNTSCLEAHASLFRLLMKGIFEPYLLLAFDKKLVF